MCPSPVDEFQGKSGHKAWNHVCLNAIYETVFFLVALHFSQIMLPLLFWHWGGYKFFSFQNLSGLCVAIWNQFIRENQLRVESHWNERWVINDRRVWSADAPFRLEDGDTNQDQYPQCLRMSFTPVEEWARVASKCRCRSRISLFMDGMDTRGLDTCLQQVFSMGWDA